MIDSFWQAKVPRRISAYQQKIRDDIGESFMNALWNHTMLKKERRLLDEQNRMLKTQIDVLTKKNGMAASYSSFEEDDEELNEVIPFDL